jgi:hypothetical protein
MGRRRWCLIDWGKEGILQLCEVYIGGWRRVIEYSKVGKGRVSTQCFGGRSELGVYDCNIATKSLYLKFSPSKPSAELQKREKNSRRHVRMAKKTCRASHSSQSRTKNWEAISLNAR